MSIINFLEQDKWNIVHKKILNGREPTYYTADDLNISSSAQLYLRMKYHDGIYNHQKLALKHFLEGKEVCLATGTSSGKTLVFHIGALDIMAKDNTATILAMYPTKALAREQAERWQNMLDAIKSQKRVGVIDGDVKPYDRNAVLKSSNIIIATPDIVHAWMMSNLREKPIRDFVSTLKLIILDEAHIYRSIFGSNMSFLIRRLRHICNLHGNDLRMIAASATIADPVGHLRCLTGKDFAVVGSETDSSLLHERQVFFVEPPSFMGLTEHISDLLNHLAHGKNRSRFLCFIDSRKQTELVASKSSKQNEEESNGENELMDFEDNIIQSLDKNTILPFRAGYELADSRKIQERLTNGSLHGVVCTSSLELGLDLPGIDVTILVGVPYSLTSLYQRMGRVGRNKPGIVLVINRGFPSDQHYFKEPENIFSLPLEPNTLYLENPYLQYIHALCLAREEGEHDQTMMKINKIDLESEFTSPLKEWPENFIELCRKERSGDIPSQVKHLKIEAQNSPNYTFPLRDCESQFKIILSQRGMTRPMGSLTFPQVMREAYPGAVYYYASTPYRVYKTNKRTKEIFVHREKRYFTSPILLPTLIYPNFTGGNVYDSFKHGELVTVEGDLQVKECVTGFKEWQGSKELTRIYGDDNIKQVLPHWDGAKMFSRELFSSGFIMHHPLMDEKGFKGEIVAKYLLQAFSMKTAIDSRELGCGFGRFKKEFRGMFPLQSRFLSLYDRAYGGLRLTSQFIRNETYRDVMHLALELMEESFEEESELSELEQVPEATIRLFRKIISCLESPRENLNIDQDEELSSNSFKTTETVVDVIEKGECGINLVNNKPFRVNDIFYNPSVSKLCYQAVYLNGKDEIKTIIPVDNADLLDTNTKTGKYNLERGEMMTGTLS